MTLIEKARMVFSATPHILTNKGLSRTALRMLQRRGYVSGEMVRIVEHRPMTNVATGTSLRWRWSATPKLMERA